MRHCSLVLIKLLVGTAGACLGFDLSARRRTCTSSSTRCRTSTTPASARAACSCPVSLNSNRCCFCCAGDSAPVDCAPLTCVRVWPLWQVDSASASPLRAPSSVTPKFCSSTRRPGDRFARRRFSCAHCAGRRLQRSGHGERARRAERAEPADEGAVARARARASSQHGSSNCVLGRAALRS